MDLYDSLMEMVITEDNTVDYIERRNLLEKFNKSDYSIGGIRVKGSTKELQSKEIFDKIYFFNNNIKMIYNNAAIYHNAYLLSFSKNKEIADEIKAEPKLKNPQSIIDDILLLDIKLKNGIFKFIFTSSILKKYSKKDKSIDDKLSYEINIKK